MHTCTCRGCSGPVSMDPEVLHPNIMFANIMMQLRVRTSGWSSTDVPSKIQYRSWAYLVMQANPLPAIPHI